MSRLRLYYPAKPYVISQGWGIVNPLYKQFGFERHNGVDFQHGTDKRLCAPIDGKIVRTGNQPNGGGIFLGLMSDQRHLFDDGRECYVLLDFLHLEHILVKEGDNVKAGDIIAIQGNTGLSTGPHTHMQPRRATYWNGGSGDSLQWTLADSNDANNTFEPAPYWTGIYAAAVQQTISLYSLLVAALSSILGVLQARR